MVKLFARLVTDKYQIYLTNLGVKNKCDGLPKKGTLPGDQLAAAAE
jgi:hypothetical protein